MDGILRMVEMMKTYDIRVKVKELSRTKVATTNTIRSIRRVSAHARVSKGPTSQ